MEKVTKPALLAGLPAWRQQKILQQAAKINAQRAEARRVEDSGPGACPAARVSNKIEQEQPAANA